MSLCNWKCGSAEQFSISNLSLVSMSPKSWQREVYTVNSTELVIQQHTLAPVMTYTLQKRDSSSIQVSELSEKLSEWLAEHQIHFILKA